MPDKSRPTPAQAWRELAAGNLRFVAGELKHPGQNAHRREEIADEQTPIAALFGCSDSRVSAEIVFDQGLGDLFVVRTAGHIVDAGVLGSLEFATEKLGVPLIVLMGHDNCGAVAATANTLKTGEVPPGFIRDVVQRIMLSALSRIDGDTEQPSFAVEDVLHRHVIETGKFILERSPLIAAAVAEGRCAIVCLEYELHEGKVRILDVHGPANVKPNFGPLVS